MSARAHRLLFVCSGNICRSPIAEYLARQRAEQRGIQLEARSAGTLHINGHPAHAKMIAVGDEIGLDLTPHRSQGVTDELVEWADYVLVKEHAHLAHLREFHAQVGEKALLLGNFAGVQEIDDPIGSWTKGPYRTARDLLQRCVNTFVDRLPETTGSEPG